MAYAVKNRSYCKVHVENENNRLTQKQKQNKQTNKNNNNNETNENIVITCNVAIPRDFLGT